MPETAKRSLLVGSPVQSAMGGVGGGMSSGIDVARRVKKLAIADSEG